MIVTLLRGPQFRAFLIALILAVCGYSFKLRFGPIDLGILFTTLLATLLATLLRPRRFGTLVIPLLVGCLGLAYTAGGPLFLALSFATITIALMYAAQPFSGLYLMTGWKTLTEQLRLLSGLTSTYQVVDDGRITVPTDGTPRPGPCLTIVSPGHAVILVSGSRETRMVGPSVIRTRRFETIKRIYDLRPRHRILEFDSVRTSESLQLAVRVEVDYGLGISSQSLSGITKLQSDEIALLARLDEYRLDWISTAEAAIEKVCRQELSFKSIMVLAQQRDTDDLERTLVGELNALLSNWRIFVHMLHVIDLQPNVAVSDVLHRSFATQNEETAQAQAWRDALRVLAEGYAYARSVGMNLDDMRTEVLRRVIVLMSEQRVAQEMAPPETFRTLQMLRRALGL